MQKPEANSGVPGAPGLFPPLDGVTHRFVDLPGLQVHLAEAGDGEPLVLLHGFPEHWWGWRRGCALPVPIAA